MRSLLPLLCVLVASPVAAFSQAWVDVDVGSAGGGTFWWQLTACSATRGRVELLAAVAPPDVPAGVHVFALARDAGCGWTLEASGSIAPGFVRVAGRCAHVAAVLRVDLVAGDGGRPAGQASGSACDG